MSISSITLLDICLAFLGVFIVGSLLRPKQTAPLPPGPRGWPLIGNVFDMPPSHEWLTFSKWGETWGVYMAI